MTFESGTRAWFVVIVARANGKELVEILDGPFAFAEGAERTARLHARDGERGPHARLRYVPRTETWIPLYGPRRMVDL